MFGVVWPCRWNTRCFVEWHFPRFELWKQMMRWCYAAGSVSRHRNCCMSPATLPLLLISPHWQVKQSTYVPARWSCRCFKRAHQGWLDIYRPYISLIYISHIFDIVDIYHFYGVFNIFNGFRVGPGHPSSPGEAGARDDYSLVVTCTRRRPICYP